MSTAALTVRAGRGFGVGASLRRNRRWAQRWFPVKERVQLILFMADI